MWFGLTDIEEEGNFKFLDGTAITGYSNFKDGAPNNWWDGQDYGGKQYIYIYIYIYI